MIMKMLAKGYQLLKTPLTVGVTSLSFYEISLHFHGGQQASWWQFWKSASPSSSIIHLIKEPAAWRPDWQLMAFAACAAIAVLLLYAYFKDARKKNKRK